MANDHVFDVAKPAKTLSNAEFLKKAQIKFFSIQMRNRRLEHVHTKLWKIFGLSFLEYESKNHHCGHLSVLGSDSIFRLTEPLPLHRFVPLVIMPKALGGQLHLHQSPTLWKANNPLQIARPNEQQGHLSLYGKSSCFVIFLFLSK